MSSTDIEKRPRPIRADDGSEDEDDSERDDQGQPSKDSAGAEEGDTTARATEKPTKKSPSRKRPAFSENNLVMEKGLMKIYREFPKRCQYKGRGREVCATLPYSSFVGTKDQCSGSITSAKWISEGRSQAVT